MQSRHRRLVDCFYFDNPDEMTSMSTSRSEQMNSDNQITNAFLFLPNQQYTANHNHRSFWKGVSLVSFGSTTNSLLYYLASMADLKRKRFREIIELGRVPVGWCSFDRCPLHWIVTSPRDFLCLSQSQSVLFQGWHRIIIHRIWSSFIDLVMCYIRW